MYRVYFAHTVKSFLCEPALSIILSYKQNVYQQLLMMYLCIKQLLNDDAWLLYEQVYYYKLSS